MEVGMEYKYAIMQWAGIGLLQMMRSRESSVRALFDLTEGKSQLQLHYAKTPIYWKSLAAGTAEKHLGGKAVQSFHCLYMGAFHPL